MNPTPKEMEGWREAFRKGHNANNISDPASDTEWVESFISTEREKAYKQGLEDAVDYIYKEKDSMRPVEAILEEAKNLSAKK